MIKNIKLFANNNITNETLTLVRDKFTRRGFEIADDNYDLAIALGGDGSFLRMVHANEFNSDLYYVGINLGTLGFAQEVNVSDIDDFITELETEKYKVEEIDIQEAEIEYGRERSKICSLNEIVVRDSNLGAVKLDISIDGDDLERYVGDAVLIASSFGSTAQNLSHGGSLVYPGFSSLQITPIGPINSRVYRALTNSVVVPSGYEIGLTPYSDKRDLIVTIDGMNRLYNDVDQIRTKIGNKRVKYLRLSRYNFTQKIKEKMINR